MINAQSAHRYFIKSIYSRNSISLGFGPPGVGKTYTASACVLNQLLQHKCQQLILIRPKSIKVIHPNDPIIDSFEQSLSKSKIRDLFMSQRVIVKSIDQLRGVKLHNSIVFVDDIQQFMQEDLYKLYACTGNNLKYVLTADTLVGEKKYASNNAFEDTIEKINLQISASDESIYDVCEFTNECIIYDQLCKINQFYIDTVKKNDG